MQHASIVNRPYKKKFGYWWIKCNRPSDSDWQKTEKCLSFSSNESYWNFLLM